MEITEMTLNDLELMKDTLYSDFDNFWSYNVLKNELENNNTTYIVALSVQKSSLSGNLFHMRACPEAVGQKLGKSTGLVSVILICHINEKILITELRHYLPTDTAGREHSGDNAILAAADCDGRKFPVAVVNRLEKGSAFCAVGGAIGGIFNVAALIHRAIRAQQRRPHLVAGIGHISVEHRFFCQRNQLFWIHNNNLFLCVLNNHRSSGSNDHFRGFSSI